MEGAAAPSTRPGSPRGTPKDTDLSLLPGLGHSPLWGQVLKPKCHLRWNLTRSAVRTQARQLRALKTFQLPSQGLHNQHSCKSWSLLGQRSRCCAHRSVRVWKSAWSDVTLCQRLSRAQPGDIGVPQLIPPLAQLQAFGAAQCHWAIPRWAQGTRLTSSGRRTHIPHKQQVLQLGFLKFEFKVLNLKHQILI